MSKMNAKSLDNPGRMIGMGRNPTGVGVVDSVLTCGFTHVPVIEYVTWTVDLPVADGFIDGTFGDEIDVLQNPKAVPGVTDVDSSFVINGILQVDMLVIGFGVHGFAEPQQGTQIGNWISDADAVPSGSVPISPDAFTTADLTGLGLPGGVTMTPALLEWGVCAQNALWHLMNAYQLQWIMQQRYLLINELAADVAYFGSYAEAVAAGSSSQAFQRYVNRVNGRYSSSPISSPGAFLPINAQRIGTVTPNSGVYHPTRAYDQLDVTYGGLRVQGMTGTLQPFRKLFKPVLLEAGIPVGIILRAQDDYHQNLMQQYLSNNDHVPGGGTFTLETIGAGISGTTATALTELTFADTANPTTVLVENQVQTDRVLLKGGALQLAILIKGFEVWGPWKKYIMNNLVSQGVVDLPSTSSGTSAG
jgi:hypothetical protein